MNKACSVANKVCLVVNKACSVANKACLELSLRRQQLLWSDIKFYLSDGKVLHGADARLTGHW